MHADHDPAATHERPTWKRGPMADLAFAALLIAAFLVLALTLRGLERL